ncbi:unnamed protein product [Paramecium primaurelia]|uniref:Uncharacterized protein n=1 Tax=Paramecium primaurelia TaxID=5886 RepID=A0A8S1P1Y4_PARPR|nr:unnamed protein product [Paramecium primaurelia]
MQQYQGQMNIQKQIYNYDLIKSSRELKEQNIEMVNFKLQVLCWRLSHLKIFQMRYLGQAKSLRILEWPNRMNMPLLHISNLTKLIQNLGHRHLHGSKNMVLTQNWQSYTIIFCSYLMSRSRCKLGV